MISVYQLTLRWILASLNYYWRYPYYVPDFFSFHFSSLVLFEFQSNPKCSVGMLFPAFAFVSDIFSFPWHPFGCGSLYTFCTHVLHQDCPLLLRGKEKEYLALLFMPSEVILLWTKMLYGRNIIRSFTIYADIIIDMSIYVFQSC